MLTIDSVTLNFNERSILAGCYLECNKGEILGLLGRNGSGKSSLLKIIFGSLRPQFSHLRIGNKIISSGYDHGQVAYLPQDNFIPPFIKVRTLMSTLIPSVRNYLSGMELINAILDKTINQLSGGMQRLVETLWVLGQESEYVLLDEPFSGLAPLHVEVLQQLIKIAAREKGIILTDHLYRPLLQISNRVVLLHNNSVYPINSERDLIQYNYIPDTL